MRRRETLRTTAPSTAPGSPASFAACLEKKDDLLGPVRALPFGPDLAAILERRFEVACQRQAQALQRSQERSPSLRSRISAAIGPTAMVWTSAQQIQDRIARNLTMYGFVRIVNGEKQEFLPDLVTIRAVWLERKEDERKKT
jgi:hypothetical protein